MIRRIGSIASVATLGFLASHCTSEDPNPGPSGGAPPLAGSGPAGSSPGGSSSGGVAGSAPVAGVAGVAGSGVSGGGTGGATGGGGSGGTVAGSAGGGGRAGGGGAGGATAGSGGGGGAAGSAGRGGGGGTGGATGGASGSGGGGAGGPAATFAQVRTIIQTSCATGQCHQTGGKHVPFADMANLHKTLTMPLANVEKCVGKTLAVANNPSGSLLPEIVGPGGASCAARMPYMCGTGGGRMCLSQSDISTISNWIMAGAPM